MFSNMALSPQTGENAMKEREVCMKRGILCLNGASYWAIQKHAVLVQRLIFNENEPLLPQAQEALWHMRRDCDWICVAAEHERVFIALALAEQLPVERLALMGEWMDGRCIHRDLRRYALRNLPLAVADAILMGASSRELQMMLRGRRYGETCLLSETRWAECAGLLTAPWEAVAEKNLLNSTKCV